MTRALRTLVAVVVCLAAALALAPASYADHVLRRDARHDVFRMSMTDGNLVRDGGVRDPDVLRTLVAHRAHHLVIRMTFAELRPHTSRLHLAIIRTDLAARVFVALQQPDRDKAVVVLATRGGPVPCPKLTYRVNYRHDRIEVSIPRGCLGAPTWVKVAAAVARVGNGSIFVDDAFMNGLSGGSDLTRRLYRG